EWVWILGDDDVPAGDSVAKILETIGRHSDAACLCFAWSGIERAGERVCNGIDHFVQELEAWDRVGFLSAIVVRGDLARRKIIEGYRYCYSMHSTLAMSLSSLAEGHKAVLSDAQIVRRGELSTYSTTNLGLGVMTLLELPMSS